MKKISKLDLHKLNEKTKEYCFKGYDIFFIHGWFVAYLSAPSDNDEDSVFPMGVILDEDQIKNEAVFSKYIDEVMSIFTAIADNIFEQNKLIKPLINLDKPNYFSNTLTIDEKSNLLKWLFGYLFGSLALGEDVYTYSQDEELIDEIYFPALWEVACVFLKLDKEAVIHDAMNDQVKADYLELKEMIIDLWESEDGGNMTIEDEVINMSLDDALDKMLPALNTVFSVVRTIDEAKFDDKHTPNTLLTNLTTLH
jgi:hypothetical protein